MFEEKSEFIHCPYCDLKAESIVDYKTNILGYLFALVLLLTLGWLSFCILPLIITLTKSAIHRCSKCLNEVKSNQFLGFNSMEDQLISFSIGSFGIALSRKYLIYITLCLVCGVLIFMIISNAEPASESIVLTGITWK